MLETQLQRFFQYKSFRPGQKEVIQALMKAKDTLAILPTGTGKSLCYQLTGFIKEGLVVIVSPLISLMEDQVDSLLRLGEKRVIALNGTLSLAEKEYALRHIKSYKFLFISPEMLSQKNILGVLQQQNIALFVIDEAHCISQWGVDFRPEYRKLGLVKKQLHDPLTLALTASATDKVKQEIKDLLLFDAQEIIYSMDRPNIALFVEETEDKFQNLVALMKNCPGPALIYCATRRQVEKLYESLHNDFSLGYYHGGLTSNERRMLQKQFNEDQLQFMVATNAFGMGIDKPNIRRVIHYDLPDCLESYLQEIGRAGRDGQASEAILLYQVGDEKIHHFFLQKATQERQSFEQALADGKITKENDLQAKWWQQAQLEGRATFCQRLAINEDQKEKKLAEMLAYIHCSQCRRQFLMHYFQEEITAFPTNCCDFHNAKRLSDNVGYQQNSLSRISWQVILLKLFKKEK